jgi:hypothetical protein
LDLRSWIEPQQSKPVAEERAVSHYSLEELAELWKREKLTVEQMIGQLLQALTAQQLRLREIERRLPPADESGAPPAASRRR